MHGTTDDVGLKPRAFKWLPLGQIRPEGWLLEQLRIQADGLSGHLDEFWPDIADSAWIGGDSDGWERGPYWLDGMVPLAFLLNDDRLQAKGHRCVEYILAHQQEDGWCGTSGSAAAAISGRGQFPPHQLGESASTSAFTNVGIPLVRGRGRFEYDYTERAMSAPG